MLISRHFLTERRFADTLAKWPLAIALVLSLSAAPLCAAEGPSEGPAAASIADDALTDEELGDEAPTMDARSLIAAVIDQSRGLSSYAEMTMNIHRVEWDRTSSLVAWTRGREDALIRFTKPTKDAGNATLKQGDKMWTFTPKLNRTIRLPFSLMSQSWAGSDFSYNDLSRTDNLLHHYTLDLTRTETQDGHKVYTVDAVPLDDAPVVWGKEELVFRDDYVLLKQTFFDQDLQPIKVMETLDIATMGGRTIAKQMRMTKLDEPEQYTEVIYSAAEFDIDIEDRTFTLFTLRGGSR